MSLESNSFTPAQDAIRNAIMDASRDLFARFGYKKTTMEDIALTLRKGKSSLYYYFKNKDEIFQAVISLESDMLYGRLKEVVDSNGDPATKLKNYVFVRMETVRNLSNYQRVIKEDLYGGYDFLLPVRQKSESLEEAYLKSILDEGVKGGVFQVVNTLTGAVGIAMALKGLEIPLFRGDENMEDFKVQLDNILNILFFGVMKR
jgi:AcrR family transcriptional regulator